MKMPKKYPPTIYTVGHSTRSLAELVEILKANGVEHLVDIRTVPRSFHNPQFNSDDLRKSLPNLGIEYTHMKTLGGLRKAKPDSPNLGWKNASFRGYADYMQTDEFLAAIEELIKLAGQRKTAVMCAEAVPWRCHRFLVADALLIRKIAVAHIIGTAKPKKHKLNPMANIRGEKITYPKNPGKGKE